MGAGAAHSDGQDAQKRISLKVNGDRLRASIRIAKNDEAPAITEDDIRTALKSAGVTFGVLTEVIAQIVEVGHTDELVEIAQGKAPQPGAAAALEYLFDPQPDHTPQTDAEGHIDYHEVNFIQGAKEGDILVRRTPPESGEPGVGVDGEPVSAPMGKDRRLPRGKNTRESDDGCELIAACNGAISFTGKEVNIRDVLTISGDIDFSTGNIKSPGSVRITGDVQAGFKVHADGDIEISGNVADAQITSHGNILVKGGFSGRGEGLIKADGNVTVKRVEGEHVEAGHDIYIGSDALNSRLVAGSRVVVRSPEGQIYGGEVVADKEIVAPSLGSEAWNPTILRVASPEHLFRELRDVKKEQRRLEEDAEKIKGALYQLVRLEMDGKLPESKKEALEKLRKFNLELPENLETLAKRQKEIEAELSKTRDARIVASNKLYPGVKGYFGVVYHDVKEERGPTMMVSYSGRVLLDEYNPHGKQAKSASAAATAN